jgi:hypothetical protein
MVMVLGEIVTVLVGGEPFSDPPAYWIVATCEIPGVMRVQALDAAAGTANASGRPRTIVIRRHRGVAFEPVALVSSFDLRSRNLGLGTTHAPVALDTAHDSTLMITDEPVTGGHRSTRFQQRRVAKHNRVTVLVAHDDLIGTAGFAAQQFRNPTTVGIGELTHRPLR